MSKDYDIGYGRPPKHSQFKKGQSGNPKGRPKGTRNLKSDLLDELAETMTLHEGGRPITLSKQRALVKSHVAKGIKGDNRSANMVFALLRTFDLDETTAEDAGLGDDDLEILDSWVKREKNKRKETQHDET